MKLSFIVLVVLVFTILSFNEGQKFSQRRRRSKEIEERINNLDEGTKKRIHAMKASGMPKDSIAEKIAYVAGGKNIAKRIVDALHDEPSTRPKKQTKTTPPAAKPKPTPIKPSNNKKK